MIRIYIYSHRQSYTTLYNTYMYHVFTEKGVSLRVARCICSTSLSLPTFVDTKRRSIARRQQLRPFRLRWGPHHGPRFEPWQLGKSLLPSGDLTWFWKITMLNTLGNSSANGPFSVAMLHFQGAYALYYDY